MSGSLATRRSVVFWRVSRHTQACCRPLPAYHPPLPRPTEKHKELLRLTAADSRADVGNLHRSSAATWPCSRSKRSWDRGGLHREGCSATPSAHPPELMLYGVLADEEMRADRTGGWHPLTAAPPLNQWSHYRRAGAPLKLHSSALVPRGFDGMFPPAASAGWTARRELPFDLFAPNSRFGFLDLCLWGNGCVSAFSLAYASTAVQWAGLHARFGKDVSVLQFYEGQSYHCQKRMQIRSRPRVNASPTYL